MSLQQNVLAGYAGQLYTTLIGILLVPQYVKYMGVEAYGLVGFFAMLQGWFALLDLGLTPTLGRAAARHKGGAIDALGLRQLLRSFEGIFVVIGLLGAVALTLGAGRIAGHWLQAGQLDIVEVRQAVVLMAWIVALRWLSGLYRGAITGFERIVWLNAFNAVVATLRFVVVVPVLAYLGSAPTYFFAYQLLVAVFEAVVLICTTYRLLPAVAAHVPWSWQPMHGVMGFALSAAATSVVWVVVTQSDKLLLSGLIPLSDYGYFTLAVLLASGISLLGSPITSALLPRLTRLQAEGDIAGVNRLYREATQMMMVVTLPVVLLMAFFPAQLLTAWTNRAEVATHSAAVLTLYAVGNGVLALAAFPYFLQVAHGNLRLHVIGNVLFVLLFVPLLLLAVARHGAVGAGYAWVLANVVPFLAWLPIVHRRFFEGMHLAWLRSDILAVAVGPTLAALLLWQWFPWPQHRLATVALLALVYMILVVLTAASSSTVRHWLSTRRQPAAA